MKTDSRSAPAAPFAPLPASPSARTPVEGPPSQLTPLDQAVADTIRADADELLRRAPLGVVAGRRLIR